MKRFVIVGLVLVVVAGLAIGTYWYTALRETPKDVSEPSNQTETAARQPLDPTGHTASDVGFAQKMILYAQQGVVIAESAKANTSNSQIQTLADEAIQKQNTTAERYKGWLGAWGEKYFNLSDFPEADGHDMYPSYPGMATVAEIRNLRDLRGGQSDEEFKRLLAQLYQGAIQTSDLLKSSMQFGEMIALRDEMATYYTLQVQTLRTN